MNFICNAEKCLREFKTERGLKQHQTRSHKNNSSISIVEVKSEQNSQIFDQEDLQEMMQDTTSSTVQIQEKQVEIDLVELECIQILKEIVEKISKEESRIKPIWYDKISVQFHVLAEELWKKNNCKKCVDLFDSFVLYLNNSAKNYQYKLMPFSKSYNQVKSALNIIDKAKFNETNRFLETINGFVEIRSLKYQRVQSIKILLELGFGSLCEKEQIQIIQPVLHDIDICLRSLRINDDSRIIFTVDRLSQDKTRKYYSCELWNLQDAAKEMKNNDNIQFNQVNTSKISENIKFFMDVDIKKKSKLINTQEQREQFIADLEQSTKTVLLMYSGMQNIEFECVSKNLLQSFHLYSNVIVKLEDCYQIIDLIQVQLITLGYIDIKISKILDCGPYANLDKKSQLRFPGSQKLQTIQEIQKDGKKDKRAVISGDLNRFLFQPKEIRNVVVNSKFHFQKISPWTINYNEELKTETNQNQIELINTKLHNEFEKEKRLLLAEMNLKLQNISVETERKNLIHLTGKSVSQLLTRLQQKYHGEKQLIQTEVDDSQFQNWINQLEDVQIDGQRISYNGECPICIKQHNSQGNRVLFVSKTENQTIVRCVRNQNETIRFNNNNAEIKQDKSDLSCWELNDEFEQRMNQKYVHFDALNYHVNFIQSAVGTGKTTQVVQNIQEFERINNRSASVLFISVRVSFSHAIVAYIKEKYGMKFDLYDDKEIQDISKCQKLMIQIESLPRLTKKIAEIKKYDFIIIDEAQSIIKQINNPICKQIDVLYSLRILTNIASHVIILDAFLNKISKRFMQSLILCRSEQTVVNSYKPYLEKQCEFQQFESSKQAKSKYIEQVISALNNNECVFSYHDERTKMLNIYDVFLSEIQNGNLNIKPEEILLLHGDNLLKQEDDADGVVKTHIKKKKNIYKQGERRLEKYKFILFTKTLTVGIDCQLEQFTTGIHLLDYCLFSMPFEIVQAIHRFRKVQKQTILFCEQKQKQDIHQSALTPFDQMKRFCTNSNGLQQDYIQINSDNICLEFQTLCEITQTYQNRFGMKLISAFMNYLGYDIIHTKMVQEFQNIYDIVQANRKLVFVEINSDTIRLCQFIRENGTNNLPKECDEIQMHEIYNVYSKTRSYLSNFYQYHEITDQLILDNQCQAFKLSKTDSQISLANQCQRLNFIRYDKKTPIQQFKYVRQELQQYINSTLDGNKTDCQLEDILESARVQAKLLFLGLAQIENQTYQSIKKCDKSLEYLLEFKTDHKQLMQKCINHCLPIGLKNDFISDKLLSEIIKSCGLKLINYRETYMNKRIRILEAQSISIPTPIIQ